MKPREFYMEKKTRYRCLSLTLFLYLTSSEVAQASAQNNLGWSAPTYEKVGIGAGIAIIAGGAVLVPYLVMRQPKLTGCTENGANGMMLRADGSNKLFSLSGGAKALPVGERVRVSGKKKKDQTFAVSRVVKDFGACSANGQ